MSAIAITIGNIETAARIDDLDTTLKSLMDIAGITSGDVAGQIFSDLDWKKESQKDRQKILFHWIMVERMYEKQEQEPSNEKILQELAANDGAILCWQVTDRAAFDAAAASGIITLDADSDCFVHPFAVNEGEGGFSMPDQKTCQHRNDGRGVCIDCGAFI